MGRSTYACGRLRISELKNSLKGYHLKKPPLNKSGSHKRAAWMGHIHAISIREKSLRSELLLPFARAGTTRLSGAAARLATLLRRRRRTAPLLRATRTLLRAWTSVLLSLRRRTAPLLRATRTLLRAWTSPLLDLRRRTATFLRATRTLLRAWTSPLLSLRRRTAPFLSATRALLRDRTSPLL